MARSSCQSLRERAGRLDEHAGATSGVLERTALEMVTLKVPRGTYVSPAADSVALRDVWAPTTIDSKAQRRRTAGGVPLPLVRARATARKCSTTFVCTDVFYCKEAMLQRCQQILCQRISPNTACFCAPSPNILTTRPHFFSRPIRFPWPAFCCQLLDPAIANVACTLAIMQLACKRAPQMPDHSPRLYCSARFQRTLVRRLNLVDAPAPPPTPTLKPPTPKPRRRHRSRRSRRRRHRSRRSRHRRRRRRWSRRRRPRRRRRRLRRRRRRRAPPLEHRPNTRQHRPHTALDPSPRSPRAPI